MNRSLIIIRKNILISRCVVNIVLVLLVFLFTKCSSNDIIVNEETKVFSRFPNEDTVSFSNLCDLKKVQPYKMILVDSHLVILNESLGAKHFLNNFSLKDNTLSNGYMSIGKGSGEALGVNGIGLHGNELWVHDVTAMKILKNDITIVLRDDNTIKTFNEYRFKTHHYMIGFKDSIHYFCVGSNVSNAKFQEIDLLSDSIINSYGKFHNIPKSISLTTLKSAYECFIYVKPTGDKVVLSYRFMDLVEFFDIKTHKNFAVHGPEVYFVMYEPGEYGIQRTKETRLSFVSGTVTNKYVYLSYSGKFNDEDYSYYGNSIFIYDWEGNPVRKLLLNKNIEGFVVSDDDKVLYAYDIDTGYLMKSIIN